MYLTSVSKLKLSEEQFRVIDTMSYRAKALYNSSLYEVKKHFERTEKYLNEFSTDVLMKNHPTNTTYRSLPAAVSQQLIKKLHINYKSFFALLKKKQNKEYDKQIDTPNYKGPDARKELIFVKSKAPNGTFRFIDGWIYITVSKDLHKGRLKLCKVPEYLKDKDFDNEIKILEIVPKLGYYELHIVYEEEAKKANNLNSNWCSIDLGMNNICTVTSNVHTPYLINGRAIKSINQKFNKKIAKAKSATKKSQNKSTSKKIRSLYNKRGYKLNNEIHKISDFIVKSVLTKKIDYVVIGYNKEWKQNINLGKKTNQNFVQIPFEKILNQLTYKLQLHGIEVHLQEESYTSKCSYFDNEEIKKHETYKGKRTNRGLFITSNGIIINADVNGSLNIHRKFIMKAADDVPKEPVSTGLVMNPIKINLRTNYSIEFLCSLMDSL